MTSTESDSTARATVVTPDAARATLTRALVELGVEEGLVTPGATLRGDFELDSIELVQVALELTRDFGVRVTLPSGPELTVAQVCELVCARAAGGPEQPGDLG